MLIIGLDVGSTSVKIVALANWLTGDSKFSPLWSEYCRHGAQPKEAARALIDHLSRAVPDIPKEDHRLFVTGTGGRPACDIMGGCFVHEVHALAKAAESRHPDTRTLIDLGGEDAKIVFFDGVGEDSRKSFAMNERCAAGTGATISRISARLGIPDEALSRLRCNGGVIHSVAGKCGVFAETDIIGLQKQGIPSQELIESLLDAVVRQSLSVLAKGKTVRPPVLLLGGPHAFIPALAAVWRKQLVALWDNHGRENRPPGDPETWVRVPEDAALFGAIGAAEIGVERLNVEGNSAALGRMKTESGHSRRSAGSPLSDAGRVQYSRGLVHSDQEAEEFLSRHRQTVLEERVCSTRDSGEYWLGIDSGSTTTKAALLTSDGTVVAKAYRQTQGDPFGDVQRVLTSLEERLRASGSAPKVRGVGLTGYAKDLLRGFVGADHVVVETVAHMYGALEHCPHADVVCDVGGQDIKLLMIRNGAVRDFRLNSQCSAGNGYYLQATAESLGYKIEDYARVAFTARSMPEFSYGCAVFLQSEIVGFQRLGWQPNEILAGLAAVLPKNIWLYVCHIPNLSSLGRVFLLQGGTQRNAAAVKAQEDFIRARFSGCGATPEIVVHPHCGEAGAIGAALYARDMSERNAFTTAFPGFQAFAKMTVSRRRDEGTRCHHCQNLCMRTFIEIKRGGMSDTRIIVANCEKGRLDTPKSGSPSPVTVETAISLPSIAAKSVFRASNLPAPEREAFSFLSRKRRSRRTDSIRIGIPRTLAMYDVAPLFLGYFIAAGVPPEGIVWSETLQEHMRERALARTGIDPCFPSKIGIVHVESLLEEHKRNPLTHIFIPCIDSLPTWLDGLQASRACPTVAMTPEAMHAAFARSTEMKEHELPRFKRTFVNLDSPDLFARQMFRDWRAELHLTEAASRSAARHGYRAYQEYLRKLRAEGMATLRGIEQNNRVALVLLGRPYHNDPDVNHGIPEMFAHHGYPVLTIESLPLDEAFLASLFRKEMEAGLCRSTTSVDDVWKNSYSENSCRKLWAAKLVARHPNLVGLELSSFKCGHDASIRTTIDEIQDAGGKPVLYFRDLDENRPQAAIRLRVETYLHCLQEYVDKLRAR